MAEIIAVFDLDGTLCQGGRLIWNELIKSQLKRPVGIFIVIFHILRQLILSYRVKLKLISEHKARMAAINSLALLISGLKIEGSSQFIETFVQKLMATIRPDMHEILNEHIKQGHKVIVVSNLFQPFMEAIGRRLGVYAAIGTGVEIRNSRCTGRVSKAICSDKQRASMLREYLQENGIEVDFGQSYAYGDTKWDRPVLEMVGNPVAVYPDAELKAYAQSHGWNIIG